MATRAAQVAVEVNAPPETVWKGLTNVDVLGTAFFGSKVETTWNVGDPIHFRGEWRGKPFEDKGEIRTLSEPRRLSFSHWSALSGNPDSPENYHIVTFELAPRGSSTQLRLTQDNANDKPIDETVKQELTKNWTGMLQGLKKSIEATTRDARS